MEKIIHSYDQIPKWLPSHFPQKNMQSDKRLPYNWNRNLAKKASLDQPLQLSTSIGEKQLGTHEKDFPHTATATGTGPTEGLPDLSIRIGIHTGFLGKPNEGRWVGSTVDGFLGYNETNSLIGFWRGGWWFP